MRYTVGDYADAVRGVPQPFAHKVLAAALMQHRVPIETVQHVNSWQFGQDQPTAGRYRYTDQSMRFQGQPETMFRTPSENLNRQAGRLLVHETHHATQHRLQPQQFEAALFDPQRRGALEAYAENEADRRVPGSVSAYDRLVAAGGNRRFSGPSYLSRRISP